MKATVLLALCMALSTAMTAQTEPADTIKIIDNAESVIITREGNRTVIKAITGNDQEALSGKIYTYDVTVEERNDSTTKEFSESIFSSFPFLNERAKKRAKNHAGSKFKPQRYATALRNIYWGWNFAYDGKAGIRNCWEAGVAELISIDWKPWRNGPDFRIGAGFGMKRFVTADNLVFAKSGDCLVFKNVNEEARDVKSRWDVWTFHVPLMISQGIYKDLGIAFGTLLNFNTYSSARTQVEIDGIRYRETFKGLQQRLFTAELIGIIGLREGIGLYAKWSPMPIMRSAYGPEFKTWTLGVSVNF